MKSLKKKIIKTLSKQLGGNPVMVDDARIGRLEDIVIKLAGEIDKLREEKEDKRKTSYAYIPINTAIKPNEERLSRDYVKKRLTEIIVDKLGVEESEVTEESSFRDDIGADSLDAVELIMDFEKEFNLEISDIDAEKVITVGDAVDVVYKLVNSK